MNRVNKLFSNKQYKILSVYYTAGFPTLNSTVTILEELERNGIDMVELGIPYSDPLADGPIIQESSTTAISNGMTINTLFEQLANFRNTVSIPVVLMTYFNPVSLFGFERFCQKAQEVGVDGLIIPDLPEYEFEKDYKAIVDKYGLSFSMLITNHTPEPRIRNISKLSTGFMYLVSTASTTGGTSDISEQQSSYFNRIAGMNLHKPLVVGFGIHDRKSFENATEYTNGAIIGSEFIRSIRQASDLSDAIKSFAQKIKE